MNVTRREEDDYTTYASIVNKHCDDFKLEELSADNFKCLIFVQGLVLNKDSEIRRCVLNKLESEQNLTLQNLAEDCERFVALKQDSRDIEENGVSHIKKSIRRKNLLQTITRKKNMEKIHLDRVGGVEITIGTMSVPTNSNNVTTATRKDIRHHIVGKNLVEGRHPLSLQKLNLRNKISGNMYRSKCLKRK